MNLKFLQPNETYLVGVSGGPDSMALLHCLVSQHYLCQVAHVNYNLRNTSLRDQQIVEVFCKQHSIPLYIKSLDTKPTTNLQAWARQIRYDFFKEIVATNHLDAVLIAHQQDDDIETFYMQKTQNKTPEYFGIKPINMYQSLRVIRPILHIARDEILKYCVRHNVSYGIDETNLKPHYLRNRVRMELSKYSAEDKDTIFNEMKYLNSQLDKVRIIVNDFLMNHSLKTGIKIAEILSNSDEVIFEISNRIFHVNKGKYGYFRRSTIEDFIDWLNTSIDGDQWGIRQFTIIRINGQIMIRDGIKKAEIITLDSPNASGILAGYKFSFTETNGVYHIPLEDADFPIKVMIPYPRGSKIALKKGHQKVSRFFINHKIPEHLRKSIPVIVNNRGIVIGIVGFHTQVGRKHMQHTLTVIK